MIIFRKKIPKKASTPKFKIDKYQWSHISYVYDRLSIIDERFVKY